MTALQSNALDTCDHFYGSLLKRPESLTDYFPYDEYLNESKIYVLKDGSLGVIFKVDLVEHEPIVSDKIVSIISSLKPCFNLPENCTLQILFDQSYISKHDKSWDELLTDIDKGNKTAQFLFQKRVEMIREKGKSFKRECFFSIRYFPDYLNSKGQFKSLFLEGEKTLFRETKLFQKEMNNFENIIENFKEGTKVNIDELDVTEFNDTLRRYLNPKTYYKREFASYNKHYPISKQVLYNTPVVDYQGLEREGVKSRTLTLKMPPSSAYYGGMSYFLELDFPYRLSMNVSFPEKRKIDSFFGLKEMFLDKAVSEKSKRQLGEIKQVQKKIAHGDKVVYLTFNIVLEADSDKELERRVRKVANIFNNMLNCEIIEEDDIGLGMYLNTFPLFYTPKADYSTARFIKILVSDLVKLLPIFDSYKGSEKVSTLYNSREGNLASFTLKEQKAISGHTCVVADTGSGKSAFIVSAIQGAKRDELEPLVFVIDKKSSHKMMAKYFDGDITIFDPQNDIPFNPFRGHYDEAKISFLTRLLQSAIKQTSPTFVLESEHTTCISKALKMAYFTKLKQMGLQYVNDELTNIESEEELELSMDDVISELAALTSIEGLESMESIVEGLINKLKPFYGDGIYAKFFRASESKTKRKNCLYYVYDLDALTDPILQSLMTMSVVEEIRQTIKMPEHRGREGYIIIEELGMFGRDNKEAASFIIDAAETFRKLGFWLIGLTPRVDNYFTIEAAKALWGVASTYIFLSMSEENIATLKKNASFLDEAIIQIIASLKTVYDDRAEVFVMDKRKERCGAFSYVQTLYEKWLCPTNHKDSVTAENALEKFFNDKWKALEYLVSNSLSGATA